MTNKELEVALRFYSRRTPFQPFLLEFFSGHQVLVDNREGVALFRQVWLFRRGAKEQALFHSSSVCRLLDIPKL